LIALAPRLGLQLAWPLLPTTKGGSGAVAAGEPMVMAMEGAWRVPPAALPKYLLHFKAELYFV
jgi:hypothetical protein